jgi:hypothetical protein
MSAFICNNSHITALAVYAVRSGLIATNDVNAIGEILHAENVNSVNYRYDETMTPSFAICEWAAFEQFSEEQIITAAHCLNYQSCEHPAWEESKAYSIVQGIIGGRDLPSDGQTPWQIIRPSPAAALGDGDETLPSPSELADHGGPEPPGPERGKSRGR